MSGHPATKIRTLSCLAENLPNQDYASEYHKQECVLKSFHVSATSLPVSIVCPAISIVRIRLDP
jgi:hypothetical protein